MQIEIDRYSDLKSIVHGMDPRLKIISFISLTFILVSTPEGKYSQFLLYFLLLFALMLLSRVPLGFMFRRSLVILPFILLAIITLPFLHGGEAIATYQIGFFTVNASIEGILLFFNILAKSWLSVLSVILLISTTPFPDLLKGLEKLRVPKIMVLTISFMCRYMNVLVDELLRMKRARDLRSCGGNRRWHIRTAGNIIGSLFIRSYERAERVYYAMLSRGYAQKVKTISNFRIRPLDTALTLTILSITVIIRLT